jgi:hypothetical protein
MKIFFGNLKTLSEETTAKLLNIVIKPAFIFFSL